MSIVTNLVKSSCEIVRVTSLKKGDVVKLLEDSSYSTELKFGIVQDVLNNGEKSVIQLLTLKNSYGDLDLELKTFTDKKELTVFPATTDELKSQFSGDLESAKRKVDEAKNTYLRKNEAYQIAEKLISGKMSLELTNSQFEVIPNAETIKLN